MKKLILYFLFFILLNNVSYAFFGNLKLICTSTQRLESITRGWEPMNRTFEIIEKGSYMIVDGNQKYKIRKDDSLKIVASQEVKKGGILTTREVRYTIMKNSLLFEFFIIQAGENGYGWTEKGRCRKL
tara:strand:+ start:148 stop:531 length:384 start_codon:yes stop_codon:yes gene_type:complete